MKINDFGMPGFADYEIGENCHLYKVEAFNRVEDDTHGTYYGGRGACYPR